MSPAPDDDRPDDTTGAFRDAAHAFDDAAPAFPAAGATERAEPTPSGPERAAPAPRRSGRARRPWRRSLAFAGASIGAPFAAAGCVLALLLALSHPEAEPSLVISPLLPVAIAIVAVAAMTLFVRHSAPHPLWAWALMAVGACALATVSTTMALTFLAGIQSGWNGVYFGLIATFLAIASFVCLGGPLWAAAGAVAGARLVGAAPFRGQARAGAIAAAAGAIACAVTWLATHGLRGHAAVEALCASRAPAVPAGDTFTGGWGWLPLGWHCSWEASGALETPPLPSVVFALALGTALLGAALLLTGRGRG